MYPILLPLYLYIPVNKQSLLLDPVSSIKLKSLLNLKKNPSRFSLSTVSTCNWWNSVEICTPLERLCWNSLKTEYTNLLKKQSKMKKEEQARSLFGISLSDRPRWQQFLICSSGFFFGYLVNGICEVWSSKPTCLFPQKMKCKVHFLLFGYGENRTDSIETVFYMLGLLWLCRQWHMWGITFKTHLLVFPERERKMHFLLFGCRENWPDSVELCFVILVYLLGSLFTLLMTSASYNLQNPPVCFTRK